MRQIAQRQAKGIGNCFVQHLNPALIVLSVGIQAYQFVPPILRKCCMITHNCVLVNDMVHQPGR